MNEYDNPFPILYHTHHQNFSEDIPFWQSLARWQGNPILELGCGTGRVLLPLSQAGHTVYGIDNSPDMIAFLKQQITPDLEPNISIINGDITNFNLDAKFRLIILPCNTYSTFDSSTRAGMLTCIFNHLAPGGVFGVSMPNPNLLLALEESTAEPILETIFNHPETGFPVQVNNKWERKGDVLTFIWHYDHLLPNGKIERLTASNHHHLTPVEQYITEMLTIGFTIRSTYRNFETGPYNPDSNYLIILAQK
ncbi:class I SAM-dependent methyltransferase [Chloroflexota bacterium]